MKNEVNYQIQFHSFWHAGSGLSGGVLNDNEVIKTDGGLPFLPGKTLKGMLRDAADTLEKTDTGLVSKDFIEIVFGEKDDKGTSCHFTNAYLSELLVKELSLSEGMQRNKLINSLYQSLSSTAIDEEGQAKNSSLRKMEVCVPLVLFAQIFDFPEGDIYTQQLDYCLKFIKRMGTKRHRGLGRCDWNRI